ncbi:ATP-dependent helicase [Mumia sp. zg.B53]|uniref:ATP-dependent DNA helicase n=1 Tax=unclassified Mumia TaxID=2621872 RepID=UPI001C6F401F|nr:MULTISPECIES: ATP-dependent DNA helicase [unclassified Mumia]MBW9215553.1 ATP-dependent helicase [Mumia sp. zg.B53]MDD9348601.1 ATP-dependent DNA helicase [Mumia sp.]
MTATAVEVPQLIHDADHLRALLGIPFSTEQMAAIQAPTDRPSAIIAGAGSGKTTVMAARVVWLVGHEGVLPGSVLGLTFTNKAASELAHRVRQALETLAREAGVPDLLERYGTPTVSTYHAYAGTLITEYGLLLGYEPDLRITTDASRFQRAFRAIASYPGSLAHATTSMPDLIGHVLGLDGQMAEHLVSPDDVRRCDAEIRVDVERATVEMRKVRLHDDLADTTRRRDELVTLVERYRAAKAEDGVVDFSDQMERGARLAVECPEVSQSQRERFSVVLLDEYQDTSVAQRDMLRGLFSGEPGDGLGHCVTAVGDPCQGIYGWRGAAASNLTAFLDDFPADPDRIGASRQRDAGRGGLFHLRVNRRSRAEILDVANRVAAPYYHVTEVVRPLVAAEGTEGGTVRAALHETVADEIAWMVDEVVAAHEGAGQPPTPWSEIAILVRTRSEIPTIVAALRARGVPVEVVGLSGLLAQPEVTDVLSVLRVLADQTANAALLRLLTGPRWRIGPRDLALLGRRAKQLVGPVREVATTSLEEELERSVRGIDPTEIVSLADAVESPDDERQRLPYSSEARARLAEVARLLRGLRRRASGSPADTARLAVAALGIDVELASTPGTAARVAQDNVTRLLDVIADVVATDPSAGLSAVLAYLDAEETYNDGLEVASPTDSDAVKLLTVHTAKGLEWDVVLVPFLTADTFPSTRSRPAWPTVAHALPHDLRGDGAELPVMAELSRAGDKEFRAAMRAEAEMEEVRLGYVAFTRARRLLITSASRWSRTRKAPSEPSPFLETVATWLRGRGDDAELWTPEPDQGADNPLRGRVEAVAWPVEPDEDDLVRRREAAARVRTYVASPPAPVDPPDPVDPVDPVEAAELARLTELDGEIERLLAEAREARGDVVQVPLPSQMSTTSLMAMRKDPDAFARSLARPLPRPPAPAARFGTRFHAWVEAHFGQQTLIGDDELPGRDETDIEDEIELGDLIRSFESGPMGDRVPYAIEEPFTLRLGGQIVSGRIDAVYRTEDGFEVVDWKTNRAATADPLQLAVYRLAWAEKHGVPLDQVTASFHYVRLGETVSYADLPDRVALEHLVHPGDT